MKCIDCGSNSKVYRTVNKEKLVIRYRKCPNCGIKFKTVETEDLTLLLTKQLIRELKGIADRMDTILG